MNVRPVQRAPTDSVKSRSRAIDTEASAQCGASRRLRDHVNDARRRLVLREAADRLGQQIEITGLLTTERTPVDPDVSRHTDIPSVVRGAGGPPHYRCDSAARSDAGSHRRTEWARLQSMMNVVTQWDRVATAAQRGTGCQPESPLAEEKTERDSRLAEDVVFERTPHATRVRSARDDR